MEHEVIPGQISIDEALATTVAHARTSDPGTSHAAARSITPETMRASQRAVLRIFERQGAMTDEQLAKEYDHRFTWEPSLFPRQSPSGLRTRRKELTDAGLLRDSGIRRKLYSGRLAIVWEIPE
jgi:hypothetical protein